MKGKLNSWPTVLSAAREERAWRGCGSYNWLLVQNRFLQIALFPELSGDHQSHLESKEGGEQNKT